MPAKGFTLLEMLAVLALIAVALGLLASALPNALANLHERQAIAGLQATLRQARTSAIIEKRDAVVAIDVAKRCYRQDQRPQKCLPAELSLQAHTAAGEQADTALMIFHRDGSASGGRLLLGGRGNFTELSVSWLTGAITERERVH